MHIESISGKVTVFIAAFLIEIVGNAMLAIMIIYEKFVANPNKRIVNNQLMSHLCGILIVENIIGLGTATYIFEFGNLGKSLLSLIQKFFFLLICLIKSYFRI